MTTGKHFSLGDLLTFNTSQVRTTINEDGALSAVTLSRRPEAKAFKRWLTREVLPSLRKRGMHIQEQERVRPVLLDALAQTVRENALPALRESDRQTEHLHWLTFKNPQRCQQECQQIADETALKFEPPRSLMAHLIQQGMNAVSEHQRLRAFPAGALQLCRGCQREWNLT